MKVSEKENIKNVLDNTSSKEDAFEVVCWFATSIEGQSYLSDLIDRDSYLLEDNFDSNLSITSEQSKRVFSAIKKDIQKTTIKPLLFKLVAVLLPFVLVLSLGFYLNTQVNLFGKSKYSEVYVPKGETLRMIFQDGSEAYLNSDTKLRYPSKFNLKNRKIYLEGEAYFNVSSNKRRPFIVEAGENSISVFGTSFNVEAYANDDNVEVVLDEGEVVFKTNLNDYSLVPGQKITYAKSSGSTSIINLRNSKNESVWKNNTLYFFNTPLNEVLKILNRRYDKTFVVNDPEALRYTYTLTSKQTTIDNILGELEKIAPVKFNLKDNQICVDL